MHDEAPRIVYTPQGRRIGYRRLGQGRPAALLHASPRSAAALLPLARALADRFTVFAFDSPGFGWSDPLALPRPDAADYGDALIEAFDALGISSAPVYGSHTGAAIAVAAAQRHPDRACALVLDGYAIFTPTEQAESLASYLAPIRPEWDGTHLAFLWGRVTDQFTFFPWYRRGDSARIARPLLPAATMQQVIVDFLAAGDNYRPAYAAAFRYDGGPELRRVAVPTTVLARTDDLLFDHLDRLGEQPDNVRVQKLGADLGVWADAVAAAMVGPAVDAPAVHQAAIDLAGSAPRLIAARVPGGVIGVTCHGCHGGRPPIVLLTGIPGSAQGVAALARALSSTRPVLAIDLPGFGVSTLEGGDARAIAAAVRAAIGLDDFDVVACAESAGVGALLAVNDRLALVDPTSDTGLLDAMADVTPRGDGAHLLAAWHQLRAMELWRPWTATDPAHAIPIGTDPDVPRLHAIMTDWMRGGAQGRATLAAALASPYPATAKSIAAPLDARALASTILERLGNGG
jgi:pimeloyl-ACP methyl ester carboxylesterase